MGFLDKLEFWSSHHDGFLKPSPRRDDSFFNTHPGRVYPPYASLRFPRRKKARRGLPMCVYSYTRRRTRTFTSPTRAHRRKYPHDKVRPFDNLGREIRRKRQRGGMCPVNPRDRVFMLMHTGEGTSSSARRTRVHARNTQRTASGVTVGFIMPCRRRGASVRLHGQRIYPGSLQDRRRDPSFFNSTTSRLYESMRSKIKKESEGLTF